MNVEYEPILFEKFPGLRGRLPWVSLGEFPTPLEPMEKLGEAIGAGSIYVKRDDLSATNYGGNKVRKLEFSLAEAIAKGRKTIITAGAVGSNHVLATTIHARTLGLDTVGIFGPQPVQENLRTNILCNRHNGCRIEYVENMGQLPMHAARVYHREWREGNRPYLLYIGGSNTAGIIGYVEGGLEIARQVGQGMMPEPEYVFVPVGSSGTFAGMILGLKLAGLGSTVVGVRVADKEVTNERVAAFMANRANKRLRRLDPSVPLVKTKPSEVFMLHDYFGKEYGRYTAKGVEAMELLYGTEGLKLEGTYSGKALAGFIDFMGPRSRKDTPVLFLDTYNSIPVDPLLEACPGPEILPEELRSYFDCELAEVQL